MSLHFFSRNSYISLSLDKPTFLEVLLVIRVQQHRELQA